MRVELVRGKWSSAIWEIRVGDQAVVVDTKWPDRTWRWFDGSQWSARTGGPIVRDGRQVTVARPVRWSTWGAVEWRLPTFTLVARPRGCSNWELRCDSRLVAIMRARKKDWRLVLAKRRIDPAMAVAVCVSLATAETAGN